MDLSFLPCTPGLLGQPQGGCEAPVARGGHAGGMALRPGPLPQDTLEKCGRCGEVVREHIIRALGRAFHPACFTCVACARCIGDENFALDSQNEVYCLDDFYRKFAPVCSICENPIIPRDGKDAFKIECMGRNFHENCYRCEDCRILLSVEPTDQGCYPLNNRLFCKPCHVKRSAAGCC